MTLLVTGGAGFIGSNFVHEWLATSDEPVVTLDKLTYAGNPDNLAGLAQGRHALVQGDIGDRALVDDLLQTHQPRAVINFAAESHVDRSISGPQAFLDTNVQATAQLLQAALGYWRSLQGPAKAGFRFVHISTDEVYGTLGPHDPAFTEDHPHRPNSPYAASKAASDHLVRAWHHTYGLPVLTTNCSNNYGPRHFPEKLIPLLITRALEGQALPIYGDGLQVRDWLHVRDHCAAIRRVLQAGALGRTYNIGGNNERTNLQVVDTLCAILDSLRPRADGQSYRLQITHVDDRPGHDRRYAIDASRIARELGWEPAVRFEDGLRDTVHWYLDNPKWVERVRSGAYRQGVAA
jgi:dTDP-glucose 4,6-dehydratase